MKYKGLTFNDWGFMRKTLKTYPTSTQNVERYYRLKSVLASNDIRGLNRDLKKLANNTHSKMKQLQKIWKGN